jgi:hypothetical protein
VTAPSPVVVTRMSEGLKQSLALAASVDRAASGASVGVTTEYVMGEEEDDGIEEEREEGRGEGNLFVTAQPYCAPSCRHLYTSTIVHHSYYRTRSIH